MKFRLLRQELNTGRRLRRALLRPFAEFSKLQVSGSILLLLATVIAIAWANSPASDSYFSLWHTKINLSAGANAISLSLAHWVNDLLMALFFLLVGLEIKRELLVGELSSPKKAALPIAAAIGGMVVPAIIYLFFNSSGDFANGWAIPMATDIAFSLGVLAILGTRVPLALKVFLAALAIVDDIASVLVIAFFYTSNIQMIPLFFAGCCVAFLILLNWLGVRRLTYYMITGAFLWVAILFSGIHATIAGILLAFTIPAWVKLDAPGFFSRAKDILQKAERFENAHPNERLSEHGQHSIQHLEEVCEDVQMPLQRLEHMLHPVVTYAIVPLFALANAGLLLPPNILEALSHPIALGTSLGLVLGKSAGIFLFSFLAVQFKWAEIPKGIAWSQILGIAFVAGIGFTMSLFIAGLAFGDGAILDIAKVGIFTGSLVSGIAGALLLSRQKREQSQPETTPSK